MALSDGLVGYWSPWLGARGYRLIDRSRYAVNATLNNMDAGTDWVGATVRGRSGYALDFDGSNDFASTSLNWIGSESRFSMSIWVRGVTGSANAGHFLSIPRASSGSNGFDFRAPAAVRVFAANAIGNAVDVATNVDIRGSWNFFTAVYNAPFVTVFCNGVQVGSGSIATTAALALDSRELNIGRFGSFGSFALVQAAEVALHRRDLTAAEHIEMFRLGPGWYQPYQRKRYAFVGAAFNRRRRILCGDYN